MSNEKKKRLSNNMEKEDDEINSKSELKKTRISGSADQESIVKSSSQTIPRQSSDRYVATLPYSEFSTKFGLQVYPVPSPSPSPEPIVHRPPPPPSTSRSPTTPASTADASRQGLSKSMVDNGQTAAEGMELRMYNEIQQFLKGKMQGEKVPQNPTSVSKDSLLVVEGETLQVIHRSENGQPNGIKHSPKVDILNNKPPGSEMQEETNPLQKLQEQGPREKMEDSVPVVQGEILQVRQRSENDSPNVMQNSQKDDMQNKKRPVCEMPEVMQASQSPQEEPLEQRPRRRSARKISSPEKKP